MGARRTVGDLKFTLLAHELRMGLAGWPDNFSRYLLDTFWAAVAQLVELVDQ